MKDPREIGGRYFSGYWRKEYIVIGKSDDGWFTCQWEDGRITTHCTAWDPKRDKIVKVPVRQIPWLSIR